MREVALGQYYPVKSVVHRLDPRIKLIMMVLYIVMIFFITTFIGYGIVLLFFAAYRGVIQGAFVKGA